jgi:signal transduction histidine kinase
VEELAISNKQLANMKEALNQSEKLASMGQLSAGIAHELNNPLGVVIMYSNILLEEMNADDAQREDLKLIVEQAERCKRIVSGLLNFARNNRVKYTETNVRQMAENSLVSLIVPKNINLIREYNLRDALATLDVEQMTQVLNNLVKNAIEAMPNGGDLILRLEDSPREITFYIIDSGCGIPTEKLEQIFEPFYTTKGIGKGTGLGLATTYGIVKMHSGKVVVTSNDDATKGKTGTTFKVVVPRYKTQ